MAWKDPFELTVDAVVDDFGQYLSKTTSLSPVEQARAQEVCRDFCTYLCKDVHEATTQDYVVYLQLHSFTPGDKADYERFLGLIRTFCSIVPARNHHVEDQAESTGLKLQRGAMKDLFSVPLDDSGSEDAPWAKNQEKKGSIRERTRRPTLTADSFTLPTPPPMSESGLLQAPDLGMEHRNAPQLNSGLFSDPSLRSGASERVSVRGSNSLDDIMFSRMGSGQRPNDENIDRAQLSCMFPMGATGSDSQFSTPARPIQSDVSLAQQQATPARAPQAVAGKNGTGISGFDFSFDENLTGGKRSAVLEPVNRRDRIADVVNEKQDMTGARAGSAISQAEERAKAHAETNSNMRGVTGINYDFSENGKKRVLSVADGGEKPLAEAIDKRLVGGFRPYLFEGKYTIDRATPVPEQFKVGKVSFFNVIVSVQPAVVCSVLSLLSFLFMPILGIVFFLLTVVAVVLALPDLLPPSNMTPHAAVMTLVQAKRGRCYCKTMALTAKDASGEAPIDPAVLWKDDLLPWPKAILARFKAPKGINLKVAAGSESKSAVVIVFEMDGGYYVVPLVRLSTGWFATDVTLSKRSFDSEPSENEKPEA